MPPARRKGYTYIEQADEDTQTTWAVIRDRDNAGIGAFASTDDIYVAIEADRQAELARAAALAEFSRTNLDEDGPDLRAAEDESVPDGSRTTTP